ncbi:hypothetical protein ACFXKD_22485 [Nocardiopsis aegyptia]|uniref:hypothetical protein n=1 Tax=Nocardiopsis aegyptia TaxID=220378 RepID=UPI003670FD34
MGLRWFRRREKPEPLPLEQLREREEGRVLDELHRQTDALHAQLREMLGVLSPEKAREVSTESPRFTSVAEGRAWLERMRALLRR